MRTPDGYKVKVLYATNTQFKGAKKKILSIKNGKVSGKITKLKKN